MASQLLAEPGISTNEKYAVVVILIVALAALAFAALARP